MSINENQEFEAINQATRERNANAKEDCNSNVEARIARKKKAVRKAILLVAATTAALVVAVVGISALEVIGWINSDFSIVLKCLAGCVAMFKLGYLWHEIKNWR